MNLKERLLQKKNLWHVGAIALFAIISIIYFHPALSGYALKQGDVEKWAGGAQEIIDYRSLGQETLWTNSMFSGMPSVQIATKYQGLALIDFLRSISTLWLPGPVGFLFLYFAGFYLLSISLKIRPYIGMIGAIAYGLSSYFIIILEAGHNTKAAAIGYAPFVIAGFIWAFRSKRWIFALAMSCLFMAFELRVNHLQITYYLAFILITIGIIELINAIKEKTIPNFSKRAVGLVLVYGIAAVINYGNIKGTLDYTKHTTRGGSELTINADGSPKTGISANESGLDVQYITNWSYGISESFSFIIPNFKGGVTQRITQNESSKSYLKEANSRVRRDVAQNVQYFGDQPFMSGPVYMGIIVVFLAVLALFYIDDRLKWGLLAVTVLTILLSWGKNFLGLTQFFVDYFPGYNKFRAVTIILFVAELTLPLLAILFLNRLIKNRETILKNIKPFYIISGVFGAILLGFLLMPEMFNTFVSTAEANQRNLATDPNSVAYFDAVFPELIKVRIAIFKADVLRSLAFLLVGFGLVFAFIRGLINQYLLSGLLLIFVFADLFTVDNRYINTETKGANANWVESWKQKYPYTAGLGEKAILEAEKSNPEVAKLLEENKAKVQKELKANKIRGGEAKQIMEHSQFRTLNRLTNFRIFEQNNPFNSSRASYFGKSIGGYHGAKLGRYQELIEFHLSNYNQAVMNMLNTKYVIASNNAQIFPNEGALGNAWFVKSIKSVKDANESILSLAVNSTYTTTAFNGYQITNGTLTDSLLKLEGTETLQLIAPNGETTPLSQVPYQATNQQEIAYVNDGTNGPQWTYYSSSLPTEMVLIRMSANQSGFSPEDEAVVINSDLKERYTGEGTIQLESYNPDHLVYKSNSDSEQFAVFSEVYYEDGWKAFIDGNEVNEIKRANFILRALEIPAGEHTIEFKFELSSYNSSNVISMSLSILAIAFILAALYFDFVRSPKEKTS